MRSPTRSSSWRRAALLAAALGATALGAERTGDYSPYPNPDTGYVTDIAGALTPEQEERIERWLWQVESRTGTEIAVVIIRTIHEYPGAKAASIESFARGLFDKYGIGNMPRNDGVLLLVAVNDRKARIELGAGYGRARDADAAAIMRDVIVPAFRNEDYAGGITAGVKAIAQEFTGVEIGFPWRIVLVFGGSVVVALIGISLVASGKRGWGWVFVGLALVLVIGAVWMLVMILKAMPRSRSYRWGSGGFGGGFGGGFSGGGGATGSW